MKKLLLVAAAAIAAILNAGTAQAAFRVTMNFPNFNPPAGANGIVLSTNAEGANSFAVQAGTGTPTNDLSSSTGVSVNRTGPSRRSAISLEDGDPTINAGELDLLITSTQAGSPFGSISSSLASVFTLSNDPVIGGGVVVPTVVITITQDAYSFSNLQNAITSTSNVFISTNVPPIFGGTTVSFVTTVSNNVNTTTINGGSKILNANGAASSFSGSSNVNGAIAGTGFITQTFTITNLQIGQHITFSNVNSVVTPLPATALMAGLAFPLLGLAGAARRRLFA